MATTSQPSSDAASQLGAPLLAVPSSSSKSARMTFEKRPRPSKSTTCSCSLGHFVGKLKERMRSEIPSFRLPGDILNSFLLSVTVGAYYVGNYVEQVAIAGESPVAYQSYNMSVPGDTSFVLSTPIPFPCCWMQTLCFSTLLSVTVCLLQRILCPEYILHCVLFSATSGDPAGRFTRRKG